MRVAGGGASIWTADVLSPSAATGTVEVLSCCFQAISDVVRLVVQVLWFDEAFSFGLVGTYYFLCPVRARGWRGGGGCVPFSIICTASVRGDVFFC